MFTGKKRSYSRPARSCVGKKKGRKGGGVGPHEQKIVDLFRTKKKGEEGTGVFLFRKGRRGGEKCFLIPD